MLFRSLASAIAGDGRSLASQAGPFRELLLSVQLADKKLAAALEAFQQASADTRRQTIYIERVASPSLPDAAGEPRRVRSVVATAAVSVIVWALVVFMNAMVREHLD